MKIFLTEEAARLMKYIVELDPQHEVGGFGKVERTKDGDILVTDLIVPPQVVGGAHTHMDLHDFAAAMEMLAKRGETLAEWNCWWHSHAQINVFASTTDVPTLDKFCDMLDQKWACGIVTNAKHEFYAWLTSNHEPCRIHLNDLDVDVNEIVNEQTLAQAVEFMKNVAIEQPQPSAPKTTGPTYTRVPVDSTSTHGMLDRNVEAVWCITHEQYDYFCDHFVTPNANCKHDLNCGPGPCFSKKEVKRRKREFEMRVDEEDAMNEYLCGDPDLPPRGLFPGSTLLELAAGGK